MAEQISSIRSSGGDYTSLSAWEAAEQTDLVTAGDIAVAECYDDWTGNGLSDSAEISGWTTDSSNYVIVRAASGEGHDGTPGSGFRMYFFGTGEVIDVQQDYTRIEQIEAINTDDGNGYNYAFKSSNANVIFDRCIGSASHHVFSVSHGLLSVDIHLRNCLGRPVGATKEPAAFNCNDTGNGTIYLYNCVAGINKSGWAINTGFEVGADTVTRNCVAFGCNTSFSGTPKTGSSHNAADDGSTTTPPGTSPITSDIVSGDFLDAANDDFHIDTDSTLYEAGADLSGTFTTDIDGDTWASTWSIGFDQPAAGGGSFTLTPNDAIHTHSVDQPTLTQANQLAPAGALHDHTADQPSLVEANVLAPADAIHSHIVDVAQLVQAHGLTPEDVLHGHTAGEPTLVQAHVLAVMSATQAHVSDSATLSVAGDITPDGVLHGHLVSSPILTQANVLTPAGSAQTHAADQPTLDTSVTIVPADASHGHTAETPALLQAHLLAVHDAMHAHLADQAALFQHLTLVADDALHAELADSPQLILGTLETPSGRVFLVRSDLHIHLARSDRGVHLIH